MSLPKSSFNGFIPSLLLAVCAAYIFPDGAALLRLGKVTDIGIGLIFFFYGLKLSPSSFRADIRNYRLHLLIHLSTFVLFPLLVLPFKPLMVGETASLLWVGMFFLAVLPSTVSSSVVMVSLAKGNIPAAIFNASISGLLGIVATPLWLGLVVADVAGVPWEAVVVKLLVQIVLPLGIGILLHRRFGASAIKHGKSIGLFDKSIIVLIVYASFSQSFKSKILSGLQMIDLFLLLGAVLSLLFLVMFCVNRLALKMRFTDKDRITAIFCGSKKSLVHGSVMAKIMFGHSAHASIYLLPIMLYHISQLLIVAVIAQRFGKRPMEA
ncbi:MAG: bile acid:sodium symporter family protein [Sediminicola sp.]|tara:strand:+ start:77859 stop:78827 length:969 start_codon:yes stop_codon:yes gene_type:complete